MKLAAFDLEIAKILEPGDYDWKAQRPLGITCAAVKATGPNPAVDNWEMEWKGTPQLSQAACEDIVNKLCWLASEGYLIVTVNGVGFDFDVLAEESGSPYTCADLAINHHVDLMLMSVCRLGIGEGGGER